MLILGILGFGILIGGLAQLIVGRAGPGVDWGMAIVAGLVGSFLGGLIWQGMRQRAAASARAAQKKAARSGRHS